MRDQVLCALPGGQAQRLLVDRGADGAVGAFGFSGEGFDGVLRPRLVAGAAKAADALGSEGQAHEAVDPLEHARQILLAFDEHDSSYARGAACDPLRDPDDFHAFFAVPDPYAVVPGAELVAHLPHLGRHPEPPERAEDQVGGLIVAILDAAPTFAFVRGAYY